MKTIVKLIPDEGIVFRTFPNTYNAEVTIIVEEDNEILGYKKGDEIKLPRKFLAYGKTKELVFPEEVEKSLKKIIEQK
jgi:hypothetical protein